MNTLSLEIMDLPGEQWEYVPGYKENYQVSNFGRVKSLIKNKPRILRKTISMGQYKVQMYWKRGRFRNELVGRLVCTLFNGKPNETDVLTFKDDNPLNIVAENMFWRTRSECARTAKNKHGYSLPGSLNGGAKLTPDKVLKIKELKATGKPSILISQEFGVSRQQVDRIVNGRKWKTI